MNIFVLDESIDKAARAHFNIHLPKMILEGTQILCTVGVEKGWDFSPDGRVYKPTHAKHPCTIWAGESLENWLWLRRFVLALADEHQARRKGNRHKSAIVAAALPLPKLPVVGMTPHAQAMPDKYKRVGDPVGAYRDYYMSPIKRGMADWSPMEAPEWWS